jgi:hypothetical protein
MIASPDTFIIDSNTGGARQWQGTWRVGRLRPPNRSVLIAYNRIGVDHQGQTVEALDVMESILGQCYICHVGESVGECPEYNFSATSVENVGICCKTSKKYKNNHFFQFFKLVKQQQHQINTFLHKYENTTNK